MFIKILLEYMQFDILTYKTVLFIDIDCEC